MDFNEKKGILSKYDKEDEKDFFINQEDIPKNELNNIKDKLSLMSEKLKIEPKLISLNFEKVIKYLNKEICKRLYECKRSKKL